MKNKYLSVTGMLMLFFSIITAPAFSIKHIILQQGLTFNPSTLLNVNIGDTVRWVWGNGTHTTTSSNIPVGAAPWNSMLTSSVTFFEYVPQVSGTYSYVCTPHISLGMVGSFQVLAGGHTLSGFLKYSNAASSGMANSTVNLMNANGTVLNTVNTGSNGSFSFSGLSDGEYMLGATTTKPWGGVNANDALLALKHFVNITPLSGMKLKAADVDNSNFVNAVDALSISKRYVSLVTSFPAGDWYIPSVTVHINGGNVTQNLSAICYGDTDGSYTP